MIKMGKKVVVYCIGLLFLAFGVTFSIKSNLGVSPVNSIPYVLSLICNMDQGKMVTIVFCTYIVLQIILLRKRFKLKNLLQIVFTSIFGLFVDVSNSMVTFPVIVNYPLRLGVLCISIMLIAIGVLLYLAADLMPMPAEGVMLALTDITGISFHKTKIGFDSTVVIIAAGLSLIFLHKLVGVREGTVIAALLVGKVIGILSKVFEKQIERLRKTLAS